MKYLIIGLPHCGTCSLERYLTEQGHEVVRSEGYYRRGASTYLPYRSRGFRAIMIISDKWSEKNLREIYDLWENWQVIYIHLNDIKKNPNFPWENRGDCLSKAGVRPLYFKDKSPQYPKP